MRKLSKAATVLSKVLSNKDITSVVSSSFGLNLGWEDGHDTMVKPLLAPATVERVLVDSGFTESNGTYTRPVTAGDRLLAKDAPSAQAITKSQIVAGKESRNKGLRQAFVNGKDSPLVTAEAVIDVVRLVHAAPYGTRDLIQNAIRGALCSNVVRSYNGTLEFIKNNGTDIAWFQNAVTATPRVVKAAITILCEIGIPEPQARGALRHALETAQNKDAAGKVEITKSINAKKQAQLDALLGFVLSEDDDEMTAAFENAGKNKEEVAELKEERADAVAELESRYSINMALKDESAMPISWEGTIKAACLIETERTFLWSMTGALKRFSQAVADMKDEISTAKEIYMEDTMSEFHQAAAMETLTSISPRYILASEMRSSLLPAFRKLNARDEFLKAKSAEKKARWAQEGEIIQYDDDEVESAMRARAKELDMMDGHGTAKEGLIGGQSDANDYTRQ